MARRSSRRSYSGRRRTSRSTARGYSRRRASGRRTRRASQRTVRIVIEQPTTARAGMLDGQLVRPSLAKKAQF